MCDACQTESQFSQSARFAPGEIEIVYVSNRATNTTRKFERSFEAEEFEEGYRYITQVSPVDFPYGENEVFDKVIAQADTVFAPVDRGDLVDLSAIGRADSVISDIQSGFVTQGMISAVSLWMQINGFFPDWESVNELLGLVGSDSGYLIGQSEALRTKILTVRINYPDGSYLTFIRQPDGSLNNWAAQDADGEPIMFNGAAVDADSLGMRSPYNFGPGNPELGQALMNLYHSLEMTRWECTMEDVPGGKVRLNCARR